MEPLQPTERRTEARRRVTGEVRLRQPGAVSGSFLGHLIDVSPTGFRIRHDRLTVASGQLVDFQWAGQTGQARAMWTRILGTEAETGFHIVHSDA
jgi:hypothetical protein